MAKRSNVSGKTVLLIIIALVVLAGLLVALAYSPVGQQLIDKIGSSGTDDKNHDKESVFTGIGGNLVAEDGTEILGEVRFEAHFIDVGQGDAILLRFGTDSETVNIMIDGGTTSTGVDDYRKELVAYLSGVLGDAPIDYMIVTHPDTDHYNMLREVMDEFVVEEIYYNNVAKNPTYSEFMEKVETELGDPGVPIDADGGTYHLELPSEDYSMTIYAPGYGRFSDGNDDYDAEESNGMSPMILVEVGSRKLLFTGDATEETEKWFIETMDTASIDIDFLKVGHHGSDTSTSAEFLSFLTPEYCVISCDDGEEYDHPSSKTMNRLFDEGIVTYRTNRQGDIVLLIDSDGDMAFKAEHEVPVENNTDGLPDLMLKTKK